jgi:hypothetical protein
MCGIKAIEFLKTCGYRFVRCNPKKLTAIKGNI